MTLDLINFDLHESQFERIRAVLHRTAGIELRKNQMGFVRNRLVQRLVTLGFRSFRQYLRYLERDLSGRELAAMVETLTTNNTRFFREPQHFEYLRREVLPALENRTGRIRFWSAGCASGEEPFSLAIEIREGLSDVGRRDLRILATDLSSHMLARAKVGVYPQEAVQPVPPHRRQRYFTRVHVGGEVAYRVNRDVRTMVRFARLNLLDRWPMKGPFDVIFCRNVMMYFDRTTKEKLVSRFWEYLADDGLLFVGHSESLAGMAHRFRYVQPAVYAK